MNRNVHMGAVIALASVIAVSVAVIAVRSHRLDDRREPSVEPRNALPGRANAIDDLIVALSNEEADLMRALDSASNDVERRQALLICRDQSVSARRLLDETRLAPTHPMAVQALAMVVNRAPDTPLGREAAELILKEHIHDESLDAAFGLFVKSESDLALKVLRAAYNSSPHARVKGRAGFSLACLLKTRAERDGWRDLSISRAETAEAEYLFAETEAHFGNLRDSRGSMAELARSQLDELHTLSVGKVAPEITGEDTDGQPMQLSDYRGKVVVLAFWGNWCSLCRSMFPYERSLVERMRDRPFVLLGVNSDNGTTIAQSLAKDQTIIWRSWRDGGEVHGGAIARRWNVQPLPDIFILDDRGVIRHHVGPRYDDHGPIYLLDAHGKLQHRWQGRFEEVLEVAEALVQELEQGHRGESSDQAR